MTLSAIQQKVYNLTSSDATKYPNSQMLVDINIWYERAVMTILRARDDWQFDDSNRTDYPILTNDLVANQQDYPLPPGTIKVRRLELSFDGSQTFYKAEPIDVNFISSGTTSTQIQQWAMTNRPYYELLDGSIFIYPFPTQTTTGKTGMKLWVYRNIVEFTASDLTNGTASPGFDAPFHQVIAYGAAYERAIAKNLSNADKIKKLIDEIFVEMANYYGNKDEDMTWSIEPAYKDYGQLNYQTGNIRRIR